VKKCRTIERPLYFVSRLGMTSSSSSSSSSGRSSLQRRYFLCFVTDKQDCFLILFLLLLSNMGDCFVMFYCLVAFEML
jgi:hypothetical protein